MYEKISRPLANSGFYDKKEVKVSCRNRGRVFISIIEGGG